MLRQNNQHTPARAAVLAAVLRTLAALSAAVVGLEIEQHDNWLAILANLNEAKQKRLLLVQPGI